MIENFTYHFGLITFPSGASVSLLWLSLSWVFGILEVQCLWSHVQFLVGVGGGDGLPLVYHTGALWARDCRCPGTDSRNSLVSSLKLSTPKSHSPPPPQHIGGLRLYLLGPAHALVGARKPQLTGEGVKPLWHERGWTLSVFSSGHPNRAFLGIGCQETGVNATGKVGSWKAGVLFWAAGCRGLFGNVTNSMWTSLVFEPGSFSS